MLFRACSIDHVHRGKLYVERLRCENASARGLIIAEDRDSDTGLPPDRCMQLRTTKAPIRCHDYQMLKKRTKDLLPRSGFDIFREVVNTRLPEEPAGTLRGFGMAKCDILLGAAPSYSNIGVQVRSTLSGKL